MTQYLYMLFLEISQIGTCFSWNTRFGYVFSHGGGGVQEALRKNIYPVSFLKSRDPLAKSTISVGIILSRISSSHCLVSSLVEAFAKFILVLIHVFWSSTFPVINTMNNVFSSSVA